MPFPIVKTDTAMIERKRRSRKSIRVSGRRKPYPGTMRNGVKLIAAADAMLVLEMTDDCLNGGVPPSHLALCGRRYPALPDPEPCEFAFDLVDQHHQENTRSLLSTPFSAPGPTVTSVCRHRQQYFGQEPKVSAIRAPAPGPDCHLLSAKDCCQYFRQSR